MRKLIVILLLVPLVIVLAVRYPEGTGHLVAMIFIVGAKILNAVVTFIGHLLRSFSRPSGGWFPVGTTVQ